jgi:hypothetical protein
MIDDLNTALVQARRLDLAREACAHRLARLASCCKPSALRERTEYLVSWFRQGQIGRMDDMSAAPITARCI